MNEALSVVMLGAAVFARGDRADRRPGCDPCGLSDHACEACAVGVVLVIIETGLQRCGYSVDRIPRVCIFTGDARDVVFFILE